MRTLWLVASLAVLAPTAALAQLDAVDPDAPKRPARNELADDSDAEEPEQPEKPARRLNQVDPDAAAPAKPDADAAAAPKPEPKAPSKGKGKKEPEPEPEPPKPTVPPILVTRAGDAELDLAWERWRTADAANDAKGEAEARAALKALKAELGADALEAMSVGLLRASRAHEKAGDSAGAIDLALSAVELAPGFPAAELGLARAYFAADPADVGRWAGQFAVGLGKIPSDPRWLRPALADLGSGLLYALVATAIAVTAVLFLRRARYFLYDFHWLFPRVVARWQSAAVGVLILSLPVLFRMGVVPALLFLFAAATMYLATRDRVVVVVLIGVLGAVPELGHLLVEHTGFAGTPAERVWALEAGGAGAEAKAQQLAKLASEGQASFGELAALGRFELRRGKLDLAVPRLKQALERQPREPRATTNLAIAMFLGGDLENPVMLLQEAAKADPGLAHPHLALARVYQRRVASFGESAAGEVDLANKALDDARNRDPALGERPLPPDDKLQGNLLVATAPLSRAQLQELAAAPATSERVRSQLTQMLLGDVPELIAPFYPLVVALLLLGLGTLRGSVGAARACNKCGAPVSHREDKEQSRASQMCTQCVNVFARKGVVPPSLKVRKQLEVAKHQQTMDRASYVFGLACSGLGHVFAGWPVRGTIYAFLFLFAVVGLIQRDGVLRNLYEAPPLVFRLAPLGLFLLLVYLLSLRGLFKKQG